MLSRDNIRKITDSKTNSFYDGFMKRSYKDRERYNRLAGIRPVVFNTAK